MAHEREQALIYCLQEGPIICSPCGGDKCIECCGLGYVIKEADLSAVNPLIDWWKEHDGTFEELVDLYYKPPINEARKALCKPTHWEGISFCNGCDPLYDDCLRPVIIEWLRMEKKHRLANRIASVRYAHYSRTDRYMPYEGTEDNGSPIEYNDKWGYVFSKYEAIMAMKWFIIEKLLNVRNR